MRMKLSIGLLIGIFIVLFTNIVISFAADQSSFYNDYVYPKSVNKTGIEPPYSNKSADQESVSPVTGDLETKKTDLMLKGKNGLDLNLTRYYNSSNSELYKPYITCQTSTSTYYTYTTEYVAKVVVFAVKYSFNGGTPLTEPYPEEYYINYGGDYSSAKAQVDYANTHYIELWGEGQEDSYYVKEWIDHGELLTYQSDPILVTTTTYSYNESLTEAEDKTGLGAGWNFDFPYIENNNGNKFLHLGNVGVWEVNLSNSNGLVNYALKDIQLTSDSGSFSNGQMTSNFVLTEKDGKKAYFGSDGRLLGITDRFGNKITFQHDTSYNGKALINKIIDSVNREISIQYTKSLVSINVADPTNSQNNRSLSYNKTVVPGCSWKATLDSVVDAENRTTKYEYTKVPARVKIRSKDFSGSNTNYYMCLKKITYPTQGEKNFNYILSTKNCGIDGLMEFYKVDNSFNSVNGKKVLNYQKYDYKIDNTGEYDGYPTYYNSDSIPESYSIKTKVSDKSGNSEIYTYNGKMLLINRLSEGSNHKNETINTYNASKLLTLSVQKTYDKASGKFMQKAENFDYNEFRDLISYWGPQNQRDTNNAPVNNEYKTTYTYDTSYYHLLIAKSYKKDAGTTILEECTPSTDHKGIIWDTIKENNVLKSKTWYDYDPNGNVIEVRKYLEDWVNYISTKFSYDDNETARNGKFNGCYLTKKIVENVFDADGKAVGTGTVSENYKYDWFGNMVEKDDAKESPTTYQYDKLGRKLKEVNPDSTFKQWVYNDAENSVIATDENNNSIKYGYDVLGNPIYSQDVTSGEILNYSEYDEKGRLSGEYGFDKKSTDYSYTSDGRANKKESKEQYTWFANSLPPGVTLSSSNDSWSWGYNLTGAQNYTISSNYTGQHQNTFEKALRKMKLATGDNIFVNVYLPSTAMPSEIMLQWKENGSWEHRAYWGANNINLGTNGTASRISMGALPVSNGWTTLVIPASAVGLEGKTLDGMAFTLFNGQAYWGKVGAYRGGNSAKILASETYSYDDANNSNGTYYSKFTKTVQGDANAPTITTNAYMDVNGQLAKQESIHVENGVTKIYTDTFIYDYLGNKVQEKSARANDESWTEPYTAKYDYNFANKPVKAYNVNGDYTTTTYDALGRTISVTDIKGNKAAQPYSTTCTYDNLGRVLIEKIPFENINGTTYYTTKKHYYDNNGNIVTEKVTNNKPGQPDSYTQTSYEYNSRNQLIKVTTYNNGVVENITQYYYDAAGNKKRMYTGLKSPLQINGLDNVVAIEDDNYTTTKYEYDRFNQITSMTDSLTKSESYIYDLNGKMIQKTDRNGNVSVFSYDALGRTLNQRVTCPDPTKNNSYSFGYSLTGNRVSASANSTGTQYTYDDLGRVKTETESNGTVKTYAYDAANNRKSMVITVNGVTKTNTTYTYDKLNRLYQVFENGQLAATYDYDDNGNRSTLTYSNGNSTSYDYNLANKLKNLINKKGTTEISHFVYTYYLDGNQESKMDTVVNKGSRYVYDDLGRLTIQNDTSNGGTTSTLYAYDDSNNRNNMSVIDSVNATQTMYTYDANNRLTADFKTTGKIKYLSDLFLADTSVNGYGPIEKDMSNGEAKAADGKVMTINGKTYAKGLGVHAKSEVVFNLAKRYTRFISDIGVDDEVGNKGTVRFLVYADDLLLFDSGIVTGALDAKTVNVSVRGHQKLKLVVESVDDATCDHADWAGAFLIPIRDTATVYISDMDWASTPINGWGPVEKDMSNGEGAAKDGHTITLRGTTYSKGIGCNANSTIVYNLDGLYSRFISDIGIDDEVNGAGQVIFKVYADGTLLYDSGMIYGNSPIKTVDVDVAGKSQLTLVVDNAGRSEYDHVDWAGARLIAAKDETQEINVYTYDDNGNQLEKYKNGLLQSSNTYDGFNQLKSTITNGVTSNYTYNADGLRTSKTVKGVITAHVWDGDQIALEMDGTGSVTNKYVRGTNLIYAENGGEKKYYLFNGHGDVVQLTGNDGSVVKTYDYDAFGNEKNLDVSDTNVFRYCGEYFDKETGTIYLRARYYAPGIGRFITEDSYRGKDNDPLSLNLYTYCGNNPISFFDPTGHDMEGDSNLPAIARDNIAIYTAKWNRAKATGDLRGMARASESANEERAKYIWKALFINDPNSVNNNGHNAVILLNSAGQGFYFSFAADYDASTGKMVTVGCASVTDMAVLTPNDMQDFYKFGSISTVWKKHNDDGELKKAPANGYQRYVAIPVNYSDGLEMYKKGKEYFDNPISYHFFANNCSQIAYNIIDAGMELPFSSAICPNSTFNNANKYFYTQYAGLRVMQIKKP